MNNVNSINNKRESNFELLRIISMIMIIAHHFAVHSGIGFSSKIVSVNRLWVQFLSTGGKIGIDIFIFISGYFLITSTKIKISKLLKLWGQIVFYSFTIYIILASMGLAKLNIKLGIKSLFPITTQAWGFASTYFLLYIFSPYFNMFLTKLSKEQYKKLLLLMTICWSIIPTFTNYSFQSNSFIFYFYLYSISGYIRLWKNDLKIDSKKCFALTIIVVILSFYITIIFDMLGTKHNFFSSHSTYLYNAKSIVVLIIALLMFLGFKNLKIKKHISINAIAATTFGIFLIHDHNCLRSVLWKKIFTSAKLASSNVLIPYSLLAITLVFVSCFFIDLIRKYTLEKLYIKFVNWIEPKINLGIEKITNLKILSKL